MSDETRDEGKARRADTVLRYRELIAGNRAQRAALSAQMDALRRELHRTGGTRVAFRRGSGVGDADREALAAIVRASDDAILSMTTDATVTTWNTGAQQLFGYTAEQMVGRPARSLVPDDELANFEAGLARIRNGEHVLAYDAWRLRHDGSRVEVSISLSGMQRRDGTLTGFCAILRDLGPRRQAEAALAAIEAEQRLVADHERIAQILNDLIISRIFSTSLTVQAAANLAGPEVQRRLDGVVEDLDQTIAELRAAIFGLRRGSPVADEPRPTDRE